MERGRIEHDRGARTQCLHEPQLMIIDVLAVSGVPRNHDGSLVAFPCEEEASRAGVGHDDFCLVGKVLQLLGLQQRGGTRMVHVGHEGTCLDEHLLAICCELICGVDQPSKGLVVGTDCDQDHRMGPRTMPSG
jgi:hypothetical protein